MNAKSLYNCLNDFSGIFPKELIYRKTAPRASKFKGKAKNEKIKTDNKANYFDTKFLVQKKKYFFREQNKTIGV